MTARLTEILDELRRKTDARDRAEATDADAKFIELLNRQIVQLREEEQDLRAHASGRRLLAPLLEDDEQARRAAMRDADPRQLDPRD